MPKAKKNSAVLTNQGPQVATEKPSVSSPAIEGDLDEKKRMIRSLGKFVEDSSEVNSDGENAVEFAGGAVVSKGKMDLTIELSKLKNETQDCQHIDGLSPDTKVIFLGECLRTLILNNQMKTFSAR